MPNTDLMPLKPDDLNPTDETILDMLHDGRCTAAYIAAEASYSRGNVRNRLNRLVEHDHVTRLHKGLFELDNDPRTDS